MPPRLGIAALLGIATIFGSNHVAARLAIDHGASVAAAVAVRSAFTAAFLFALLKATRTPITFTPKALAVGSLVALQSFCLYSAVARLQVALALLVFNIYPMLFMLLSATTGKEKLRPVSLFAMPLALVGLALVLDVRPSGWSERWSELGPGVAYAVTAGVSFALVMYLNTHWLKGLDGRVRTLYMMSVTAVLVMAGGAAAGALALPHDAAGWLGLALLTLLYGTAITSLFVVLPRLGGGAASTVALNFEPIAVLVIAWIVLGQRVNGTQLLGAFVVVGAIAWLSAAKR
ncbi:MAG: DMT family transporter [Betaproteobacteria bacterium]|nr:DMT family transporter [Betaproteobacteria bacterium]